MNSTDPVQYKIRLEPDLESFKFGGQVELLLEARDPVDQICLNVLELAVWRCRVKENDGLVACPFEVNPAKEELKINLPYKMSGHILLNIEYEGIINDKMAGFYRSKYKKNDRTKFIAVTQFQESDARRAFPCMDHPAQKAVFDIELIVDQDLTAISNGPVLSQDDLPDGKKRVRFQQTPKMSTYLLFWGVGEFDFITDAKDRRVRAAVLPGMADYSRFGLDFGRKALHFCEDYYRIAYVLPKMDLIAIPDFAFGAMENWGAITFRENLILHYPEITSRLGEQRICEVIAHEIVHQWFGNLVTPSDWKYLWLNESFATYFSYGVVDHYYPDWRIWDQFLLGQTAAAMERDSLTDTCAIEIPGGEHVVINTSTAPIIYSKGSSILRIVQDYIGPDDFRQGLTHYLEAYAYANASSRHLWEAYEKVAHKPVSALMKSWVEQPGFPVVTAQRDGNKLTLTQKRFTYLPHTSGQHWMIPVTIEIFFDSGESRLISTLLEKESIQIDIGDDAAGYKVNSGQTGFYRVRYVASGDLDRLGQQVSMQRLSPEDRWGLQSDLFALVQSGAAGIQDYLEFIAYYENETADLPLSSISGNLFQSYLIVKGAQKNAVASTGKLFLEKILEKIGYVPAPEEAFATSMLRDQILWQAVVYGSNKAVDFAGRQFNSLLKGQRVHPDILKSVFKAGALTGRRETLDWLIDRFETSRSEHERINVLTALGCFSQWPLCQKALQYVLDNVPDKNRFIPIVSAAVNPHATGYMWDWFVSNIDQLEKIHPLLFERVIAGIVPLGGLEKPKEVKLFLNRYIQKNARAAEVINLAIEKLDINLNIRHS